MFYCSSLKKYNRSTDRGDPEDAVLVYKAVEVLVEEEEARAYEGRVREVQLTLSHVSDLKKRHRETRNHMH